MKEIEEYVHDCVGCGYCCMKTPCDVARRLYPGVENCPQLEWYEDRYICGLMKLQEPLGSHYREILFAGAGCCCSLNSWRKDVKKRTSVEGLWINPLPPIFQIFLNSLSKQFISGDQFALTVIDMKAQMIKMCYDKDETDNIIKSVVSALTENRSKFMKEFMG